MTQHSISGGDDYGANPCKGTPASGPTGAQRTAPSATRSRAARVPCPATGRTPKGGMDFTCNYDV